MSRRATIRRALCGTISSTGPPVYEDLELPLRPSNRMQNTRGRACVGKFTEISAALSRKSVQGRCGTTEAFDAHSGATRNPTGIPSGTAATDDIKNRLWHDTPAIRAWSPHVEGGGSKGVRMAYTASDKSASKECSVLPKSLPFHLPQCLFRPFFKAPVFPRMRNLSSS